MPGVYGNQGGVAVPIIGPAGADGFQGREGTSAEMPIADGTQGIWRLTDGPGGTWADIAGTWRQVAMESDLAALSSTFLQSADALIDHPARVWLAPTAQGDGSGDSFANAASYRDRMTVEATLKAAAVADPTMKAPGTPEGVAINVCWRADLGEYDCSDVTTPPSLDVAPSTLIFYYMTSDHGGISATRRLQHIGVNAQRRPVGFRLDVNPRGGYFTVDGSPDDCVIFRGSRTPDPRTAAQIAAGVVLNVSGSTGYPLNPALPYASRSTAILPGRGKDAAGNVVDFGLTSFNSGNIFEWGVGGYGFVDWAGGFSWRDMREVLVPRADFASDGHLRVYGGTHCANIEAFVYGSTPSASVDRYFYIRDHWNESACENLLRFIGGGEYHLYNVVHDTGLQANTTAPAMLGMSDNNDVSVYSARRFICRNQYELPTSSSGFMQGDGLDMSGGESAIVQDFLIEGVGDGGIDCKADGAIISDGRIVGAQHSVRVWYRLDAEDVKVIERVDSIAPRSSHLFLNRGEEVRVSDSIWRADPDHPTPASYDIITASSQEALTAHSEVSLTNVTILHPSTGPAWDAEDNTDTYPTTADAESAGDWQITLTRDALVAS